MKRKRILAMILAVASCLSLAISASAANPVNRKATDFRDYDRTAWYAEAVSAAVDNGLLYGKSATVIDPNGDMTRAEMAAIINRSFGCYKAADISQYKDVSKSKWYYKDVALAVQMGTYNGRSSSTMAPDAPISRQEAMTVVARALELDYADHSYSYGSWVSDSETQHKRTKTCSACGDSGYEYADHTDANGDGKCDDCGATVSLTIKWDTGTNGGTIDGKTSITTTGKPNATATAPTSTPVKAGHAFKGWYTAASGGSLYNTVTITAAKTFYAQFTANSYTLTWDLGNGTTEETKQTYGEKLTLPTEPTRKNAEFLGWFTEVNGGTQVDANTIYKTDADSTYYAHWEITEVFSVTVPVTLPLIVDEGGEVHVGAAEIINASTGDVIVSSVSISTKNGWQLVPFDTDMAHEKVDARLLGFKINDSETTKTGDAETFSLTSPWTIAENGKLPLSYDAVVSAVSQPVTEQDVLSVVFVLEWKGE